MEMLEIFTSCESYEYTRAVRRAVNPEAIASGNEIDLSHNSPASIELQRRIQGESSETVELVASLALRSLQLEAAGDDVASLVSQARKQGLSWQRVGRAAGVSSTTARRRWKHDSPIPV
jgi:hypothetical protein